MGRHKKEDLSDDALIAAARRRLLAEFGQAAPAARPASGGGAESSPGGVMAALGGRSTPQPEGDDPYSYYVHVARENTPNGWVKDVHRFKEKKK